MGTLADLVTAVSPADTGQGDKPAGTVLILSSMGGTKSRVWLSNQGQRTWMPVKLSGGRSGVRIAGELSGADQGDQAATQLLVLDCHGDQAASGTTALTSVSQKIFHQDGEKRGIRLETEQPGTG